MKTLTEKDVDFEMEVDFCDLDVRGNAIASGDNEYDKKIEDEIIQRLENGDYWAWADVTVRASWGDFHGIATLGACTYDNREDFKKNSGYYEDLKQEALDDLNKNIKETAEKLKTLEVK